MIENDGDDHIDKSVQLPDGHPIITPERAAKGDVFTGPSCDACHGSGKSGEYNSPCRVCHGKGWVGSVNADSVEISEIKFAQIRVRNLLNFFWEIDLIDDQQHHDALTFQIWRDMHRVAMGQIKPISSGNPETTGTRLRAQGYVLLLKRLSIYDYRAIENSLEVFATSHTEALARRDREIYRRAFRRLSAVIIPVREKITYLESLTDEEREQMAEHDLKKFLDQITNRS